MTYKIKLNGGIIVIRKRSKVLVFCMITSMMLFGSGIAGYAAHTDVLNVITEFSAAGDGRLWQNGVLHP